MKDPWRPLRLNLSLQPTDNQPVNWNYKYIYWHQNLRCAEPQQLLFAMDLSGRYIK